MLRQHNSHPNTSPHRYFNRSEQTMAVTHRPRNATDCITSRITHRKMSMRNADLFLQKQNFQTHR